ncbi:hypothetical protein DRP04_15575 [Archaeoglobales archaeon]|nr:MAG: hypothetical protein DRP04_15575 [Archaeoglobales archaeon]HDN74215.1 hypothetical protein [Archaeoglobus sp.]
MKLEIDAEAINALSKSIDNLKKAKNKLEKLMGSVVDSREALDIFSETSSLLGDVLSTLEPLYVEIRCIVEISSRGLLKEENASNEQKR